MTPRRLAIAGLSAVALIALGLGAWALVSDGEPGASSGSSPGPTAGPEATPGTREVEVFLSRSDEERCDRVYPVSRTVGADVPLRAALEELLAGPSAAEEADGYTSWFSEETEGMLRDTEVSDGVARVDFEDFSGIIPNASTSCGSAALLGQLERTVEQFPEVLRAVYSFDGDVEAFYGWLQLAPPTEPSCSAAGMSPDLEPQPELPDAVRELRSEIARQAVTCDYTDLERLATGDGDDDFTFSFGGGESAAAFWHRHEEDRGEPMRFLVGLLDRPYEALDDGTYVWPSAFAYDDWSDVPEDDREALRPLYTSDDFEGWAEFGSYSGYRIGITPDGDWLYFVRGD